MQTPLHSTIGPRVAVESEDGLFGRYSEQFFQHLASQRYAPTTFAEYRRRVRTLGRMLQERKLPLSRLTAEMAVTLIEASSCPVTKRSFAGRIVKRFVAFLIERGVLPPAMTETLRAGLRREYGQYLRHHRGLSEESIYNCWRTADRFLSHCFGNKAGDVAAVTQADIIDFLHHLHAGPRRYRVKTTSTHLRQFFRFLFNSGKTKLNLSLGIPSVAQRYGARLRRHLTPDQVEALLNCIRSCPIQRRRNYAMVLLMARLGLRAPEVIAMRIDDVDWRAGELIVRGKGQLHDRLPLPPDVGAALTEYIRLDRKTMSRALFVSARAPHGPFKGSEILNTVLKDAFARTGIKPPAPYVGSHVLRHSLAVKLIQRGASLDEIADTLRHRSRATTMIYARLDVESLRGVARSWPITGGAQ